MTPRITPGDRRQIGIPAWLFAKAAGRVTGTGPPGIFTTLGRTRRLFWGWLLFAGGLMPGGTLPRRDTELVILRVAHVRDCDYERTHHEGLGRRVGLTDAEISRVAEGSQAPGWSERQQVLLEAAEELLERRALSDATWTALRAHLSERSCIEFLLLVGHYDMLATTLMTLGVVPDAPRGAPRR
ncbi:carboxymuconolactone decarboxylase family protein [Nocardioides massiliensis]|uniref:AhpD family alkylhydroperoxidase n=1 Tax=Nocardioides massiliensis TaxID=1325935 RepID=A0ABT9NS04_9ACTN|nr:carboxymuconolactone decarboxylase family protein [Nocardioides massiliensis]MDP9823206.1 AhpD family alkylhydroperoxidase [Nocardioides massiliensis]